jgi:polar amino acid transport system substrate-binding protein
LSKYFGLKICYLSILLLPGLTYAPNVGAQETEPVFLTVYTAESFPLSFTDQENQNEPLVGYATELIKIILEHAEIDFKVEIVPWGRAIQAINNRKNVIAYSMTRSPEREDRYQWIGKISPLDYYLYGLKSRLTSLPSTIEGAKALKVGIVRGAFISNFLIAEDFSNLINVSEPSRNLQMLKRGRIDLFPFNTRGVGPMLTQHNFDTDELVGIIRLDTDSTGLYFALSKQTSAAVLRRLQDSYNAVVKSGQYERIFRPFLEQNPRLEVLTIDSQR